MLDPGHGGIDGGAEGLNGTVEKDITLAFALQLRDELGATGTLDVFMTREADQFLTSTNASGSPASTAPTCFCRSMPTRST